ncbi:MAG: hypothetical protein QOJ07_3711, partial [Thermoleophilaceae bacterium]|nr:hypothetical protein [Thermoleophilaceae bacterium]
MRRLPLILALSSLLVAAVPAAASAKVATGPSGAAFYKPPKKLPGSHHGDPIWARKLTGGAALTSASV